MGEIASSPAPTNVEAVSERSASGRLASAASHGARVLLADDLDLNRKLIADMLSIEGHSVDCVADGAAAVRAVEANRYDLVLMDIVMPLMDGVAATRAIRALCGPAGEVPIIALTANAFPEHQNEYLQAGMNAVVTKPMSFESLTTVVARWAQARRVSA